MLNFREWFEFHTIRRLNTVFVVRACCVLLFFSHIFISPRYYNVAIPFYLVLIRIVSACACNLLHRYHRCIVEIFFLSVFLALSCSACTSYILFSLEFLHVAVDLSLSKSHHNNFII